MTSFISNLDFAHLIDEEIQRASNKARILAECYYVNKDANVREQARDLAIAAEEISNRSARLLRAIADLEDAARKRERNGRED